MKTTTFFRLLCGTAFSLLLSSAAQAQLPGSGGPTPGAPPIVPDDGPTAVPIDGGVSLLLAGGATYGLRKLRQRRR